MLPHPEAEYLDVELGLLLLQCVASVLLTTGHPSHQPLCHNPTTVIKIQCLSVRYRGPGEFTRYSESLHAERSGDRTRPDRRREPTQPPTKWVRGLSRG